VGPSSSGSCPMAYSDFSFFHPRVLLLPRYLAHYSNSGILAIRVGGAYSYYRPVND
jgi:hypothetical protein